MAHLRKAPRESIQILDVLQEAKLEQRSRLHNCMGTPKQKGVVITAGFFSSEAAPANAATNKTDPH